MAILRVADTLNSAKCTDVKKTFVYRSNPANRGLSARYNERFSLLHFWTVKYMKNNLDQNETSLYHCYTKRTYYFASPLAFVRYIEVPLYVVGFRGLRNLSLQSIWEIDVYSAVLQVDWASRSLSPSSWILIIFGWEKRSCSNTCPFRFLFVIT